LQAALLAAGRGDRLRPVTEHVPKPLIPLWGKPFIGYVLDNLQGFIDEAFIVIDPGEEIKRQLGDAHRDIALRYVRQDYPMGTGDALLQTRGMLDDPFLVLLADTCPARETVAQMVRAGGDAVLTVIEVPDPENHPGVSLLNGFLVEELWTQSSFVDAGVFRFSSDIYEVLEGLPPIRNELRVLQGVQELLRSGGEVQAVQMEDPWLQFGDHEGVSGVLRVMRELRPPEAASSDSSIEVTTRDCDIHDSLVFGPGELINCAIKDSLVYCAGRVERRSADGEIAAWT